MLNKHEGGRIYDIITGKRVELGENILDTEILTRNYSPTQAIQSQRTLFVKEDTVVWLAEKAGYTLTRSDAGDSRNTEVVDESDASTGGGETPLGTPPTGGSKAPNGRTNGKPKGR